MEARTFTITEGPGRKLGAARTLPLTDQDLSLLAEAKTLPKASGLVFPSLRGKVLDGATMKLAMGDLTRKGTVHGFRSAFTHFCVEQGVHDAYRKKQMGTP